MREAFGIKITPLARSTTNYGGYVATARSQLDEASFAEAWSEGHAMTTEEAVEYALAEDEAAASYLSPHTVGQRLRSIYRKLGVSSRAAAKEALEPGMIRAVQHRLPTRATWTTDLVHLYYVI